jgi:hypothetical protein
MLTCPKIVSVMMQRVADSRVWVAVSFSLCQKVYVPGERYLAYSDDFHCAVTPLDEEAARAFREDHAEMAAEAAEEDQEFVCGWGGWVMEGTHQGFRLRKMPDRGIIVSRLEGCLGADGDVEGLIWAGVLGVVLLLGGEGSEVETPGWKTTRYSID